MNKKSKASSLVDYVVPLAVVGLVVGLGLYFLISSGFFNKLLLSANMNVDPSTQKGTINKNKQPEEMAIDKKSTELSQKKAGSLGGTPDKPVIECFGGNCTIDYGDFVLTGVPEHMDEFIESAATSGGTDKLVSLIEQIAKQLEEEGDTAGSLEIKKLASIGHNLATMERSMETMVNECSGMENCINDNLQTNIEKPEGFDERFYNYEPASFNDYNTLLNVGESSSNPNYPAQLFATQYETLMNSNLTSSTKSVLSELYWHVGKLAITMTHGMTDLQTTMTRSSGGNYIDPITGEIVTTNDDIPNNLRDIFTGYKPSTFTHFDSALICATGQNYDSGKKCH